MSAEELYDRLVSDLPEREQRELASYILWRCAKARPVQWSTEWSDEDMRDLTAYSMALFDAREAIEAGE